jgi:threonine/homoserine efflux transporter RhtA
LTAPAVVGTVQPASIHSAQQPSILKPTVAPQAKPAMAQTGAGLQATLVQAIKKSETTTVRTIKAPAMLIATVTPRKQDFKAITQRLGNKKFLGVY